MTRTLSPRVLAILVAALGAVVLVTAPRAVATENPARHTITIDATAFAPADLTVHAGDTVVWLNKDPYPHTATSKAAGFDSDDIRSGKSWKYVAKEKGDFPYVCSIHPSMKGTLHVK
jgi:plastocyanin